MNNYMPSKLFSDLVAIAHETLDLSSDSLEMTVHNGRIVFQSRHSGFCVTVIADPLSARLGDVGVHQHFDEDFDEYTLSDLLEQASRGGYEAIFIHPEVLK